MNDLQDLDQRQQHSFANLGDLVEVVVLTHHERVIEQINFNYEFDTYHRSHNADDDSLGCQVAHLLESHAQHQN